jgi:multidrug efflux pump subunit AcrB
MFPPTALDKILLSGYYGSSSNEVLDRLIVRDCENIFKEHPFISNISSMVSSGSYHVTGDIKKGAKKEQVVSEIENELKGLEENLPSDFHLPTVKTVEQYFPLMSISLFSDLVEKEKVVEVARALKDEIKNFEHIYESVLVGKYDRIMQLNIDDKAILAHGLQRGDVYKQIASLYSIFPIGDIISDNEQYFISTKTTDVNPHKILEYQIKIKDKIVRLGDIAKLKYRFEKHALLTKTDGVRSLVINVKKAKRGDSIAISKKIKKLLNSYEKTYPNIHFKVLSDSSLWIKKRLNVISSNIIIGMILLFFAIWIFISLKIALVVLIGIPVSLSFGIIGLDVIDGSLNTLSMIGVLLSLGLLVDEAIVVSENIHRHKMLGKSSHDACLDGVSEVLPVLFASMLTTVIAFLPLTTLTGGLGAFLQIIPLMVIVLIVSSFLESFIFLPLHYITFGQYFEKQNSYGDAFWEKSNLIYQKILRFLFKRKVLWLVVFVLSIIIATVLMLKMSKFNLFPEFDAMNINISAKVSHNDIKYTIGQTKILEEILLENIDKNNVASIHTIVGMKTDGRGQHEKAKNRFTITLNLHPKKSKDFFNRVINPYFKVFGETKGEATRTMTAKEISQKIEKIFAQDSRCKDFMELSFDIPQTGVVKSDVVILVSHKEDTEIKQALQTLKQQMHKMQGVYNIKDDMKFDNSDIQIDINSYGKSLGFTQLSLNRALREYVQIDRLSKVVNDKDEFMEVKMGFLNKNSLETLKNLHINIQNTQKQVALKDIATFSISKKTTMIKKEDLQKVYTLQASLDKKILTSRAFYRELNPLLKELRAKGIKITIKGEAKKNAQMKKDIFKSLIFSIFGILLILTWVFKSIRLSLFALTPIPLSILGVLIGHKILGLNLTLSSILGLVGLIGIIVNDTALMLSFIQKAKNQEEVIENAILRLKPILLTSLTTMLGFGSLIFFASGESLLMQPLAVSIGFGLLWATVVNLFYVPLGYSLGKG